MEVIRCMLHCWTRGDSSNVLTTDSHAFTYQSGSAGNQSGDSGTQSPDGIFIHYPNVGTLYDDGNGLQVHWNYQSQDNAMQSLIVQVGRRFLRTSTSATQVSGTDSVSGSSWLSGVLWKSYAVCCVVGSARRHAFTYQSGSGQPKPR